MKKFATDGWMNHRTYLWPEGKKRRALAIHEQELADEDLAAARVVVDAEGEGAGGVVDGEAVGALEAHAGPLPHRVPQRRRRRRRISAAAVANQRPCRLGGGVDPGGRHAGAGPIREGRCH